MPTRFYFEGDSVIGPSEQGLIHVHQGDELPRTRPLFFIHGHPLEGPIEEHEASYHNFHGVNGYQNHIHVLSSFAEENGLPPHPIIKRDG